MDKICLFNTITNTIETYNTEGKIINKSEAKFVNDKKFTGKIIKDESGKNLYAVYKEGGVYMDSDIYLRKNGLHLPQMPIF
jgi:hypothetical protein